MNKDGITCVGRNPVMSWWTAQMQQSSGPVCRMCLQEPGDPEKLGEFLQRDNLRIHYFCLILSSGLPQRGRASDGFHGFLPEDIKKETSRAARKARNPENTGLCPLFCPFPFPLLGSESLLSTVPSPSAPDSGGLEVLIEEGADKPWRFHRGPLPLSTRALPFFADVLGAMVSPFWGCEHCLGFQLQTCFVCKKKGAAIFCQKERCRRNFHLPCGRERGCISQFFGEYKSFCEKHRPTQDIQPEKRAEEDCILCCESLSGGNDDNIQSPCCSRMMYHRKCIQKYAHSSAKHFFKCPQCNNREEFPKEMLRMGIHIPDR
ncbi:PHD finger protein 7 isoform X2 [Vombatus ursinus]|uniref:PHD finger protein 7 isoform X2 n=2 Tax=Vombatus ursinus TaxID=29139 RepID=UPI000FFD90EA|nr:PHD finger protein 7 isoform X2 [Vombatus ursinus]